MNSVCIKSGQTILSIILYDVQEKNSFIHPDIGLILKVYFEEEVLKDIYADCFD